MFTSQTFTHCLLLFLLAGNVTPADPDFAPDLHALRAISREGAGNEAAQSAVKRLSALDASRLPQLLAGFDGASPQARNWLRGVIEAIADRALTAGKTLPAAALEAFAVDRSQDVHARRLAYDWVLRVDPTAADRVLLRALDDPAVSIRRDAVERDLRIAEELLKQEKRDEAKAAFAKLFPQARDRDQVERIAKQLESLGEKPNLTRHFGFVRHWRLLGPFDNSSKQGYGRVHAPEEKLDLAAELDGKSGKIRWFEYETTDSHGKVDLNKAIGKHMGVVAYAVAELEIPEARGGEIRAGSANAVKIWLNGELVFQRDEYHHGMDPDQYQSSVKFRSGRNTILIKVCQNEGKEEWEQDWVFQLRVCDATGGGIL